MPDAIQPDLSPGMGWHRTPGFAMPGSTTDLLSRAERAFRCWVLPMRRNGRRASAESLLHEEPIYGGLLMMDRYDEWDAHLLETEEFRSDLLLLVRARLVRDRGGCRLYQGFARDHTGTPTITQTWLCTPSPERTREILAKMAESEWD